MKLLLQQEDENWFVVSKLSFCLSSGEGELQHGARFLLHNFLMEMRMRMRWGMMMNEIFPLKMFIAELKLKKANITSTTKRMHGMRIFTIMFIVRRNRANADVGTPQHKWKHFSTTTIPLSRKRLRRGGGNICIYNQPDSKCVQSISSFTVRLNFVWKLFPWSFALICIKFMWIV